MIKYAKDYLPPKDTRSFTKNHPQLQDNMNVFLGMRLQAGKSLYKGLAGRRILGGGEGGARDIGEDQPRPMLPPVSAQFILSPVQ